MHKLEHQGIASLLLRQWDALAVVDADTEPASEYLYEADQILALLRAGHGVDDLVAYLGEAAGEMGSTPNEVRDRRAAAAIWERFADPR